MVSPLLAEAYDTMGEPELGLTMLAEALVLVDKTGERWYEPEIHRLKGALLLQQSPDNHTEAQSCFQHALEVARCKQAKSLELRAATSLARLWQQQGKRNNARLLPCRVYSGLPKVSTPPICRRPKRYWRSCPGVKTLSASNVLRRRCPMSRQLRSGVISPPLPDSPPQSSSTSSGFSMSPQGGI